MKKVKVLVAQSCLTLCDPMDCSLPGSSVHGILQARIPEWVAIPFPRGSSWPRDQSQVSCIAGRFFSTELLNNRNVFLTVLAARKDWQMWRLLRAHFLVHRWTFSSMLAQGRRAQVMLWVSSVRALILFRWASLVTQMVKIHQQFWRPGFDPWVGKIPWRRERLPATHSSMLAWRIPWTEESGRLQSKIAKIRTEWSDFHFTLSS